MLVAATGPVVTAGLALLVVNAVTSWAQRRREAAEARDILATELTEIANTLYLALQSFWRAAREVPLTERRQLPALGTDRDELDAVYQVARSKGQVLEQRLKIYFASPEPSNAWHRVTDLLTVRYFLLLEGDPERRARMRRINSGPDHSALTQDELDNPRLVLETYRLALAETIASLWNYDVDRRGRHLRGTTNVRTWHGSASEGDLAPSLNP
jgi:hypothetical protein